MDWKVQLFKLNFDHREQDAVKAVLESGWITMGQKTLDFESEYAKLLGQGVKCLAVSSGTAALHIACLALGIGPEDEVIVPGLTFIADLNVVKMCGAEPVLVDVTSVDADWAMDPADIEAKITPKTKAIMIVHYAGYACDMEAICGICKRHNLPLIEDCAHAPGGSYKGQALGTFGDVSCWSFFTNKNLSVGEGGMVVVKTDELYQRCKNLRSHGMTVASFDRMKGRASTYDVAAPGLNYRIDEMRAALGLVQLDKLVDANAKRKVLTEHYFELLDKADNVTIPFRHFNRGIPTYHIMPILLAEGLDRQRVISKLAEQGVQASVHYPFIPHFTAYLGVKGAIPKTEIISARELTLPIYPTMSIDQVDYVCTALWKALV